MENYNKVSQSIPPQTNDAKVDITPAYLYVDAGADVDIDEHGIVIDCVFLNIRRRSESDADVVDTIPCSTEVVVDVSNSTDGFYKIHTASGIEGFCMKQFISIDQ